MMSAVARGHGACAEDLLTVDNGHDVGNLGARDYCSIAAEQGHLGMLRWLRANGCPWVDQQRLLRGVMLTGSSSDKSLACLVWARANGYDRSVVGEQWEAVMDDWIRKRQAGAVVDSFFNLARCNVPSHESASLL